MHTEAGLSIRALARDEGVHASTVLRQVRRFETRRDDPLVDEALRHLMDKALTAPNPEVGPEPEDDSQMTAHFRGTTKADSDPDETMIDREARRILRRLSETGAVLALAPELDKAVVLRDGPDGRTTRTAVVARAVAQAFALKEWIARKATSGKVATYEITFAGRAALKRLLTDDLDARGGFAEAPSRFAEQHRDWEDQDVAEPGEGARRLRINVAESPLAALARRREKDGSHFLSPELVSAGERLREDFELAQMGPRVTQNWDRFLTAGVDKGGVLPESLRGGGSDAARARVAAALTDLGPGLGDTVLRVCCFLEGLEATERRMGWSARSGKIVLRIALQRLRRHYDETEGRYGGMIG